MEQVKLIRMSTGEDIIAYFEQVDTNNFVVREPMMVMLSMENRSGKQTVQMDHWLPTSLILHNEAYITDKDIVAIMNPSSEFSEYYENAVGAIEVARENKSSKYKSSQVESSDDDASLSTDDMNMILDSMIQPKDTNKYH